jgi:hypothetical protein
MDGIPVCGAKLALIFSGVVLLSCNSTDHKTQASSAGASAKDAISFDVKDDRVRVLAGDRVLTNYIFSAKWDKPFVFPITSASGDVVSRGYPVEPRPGEKQDHPWHRGIWYGHGDINGVDFWREEGADVAGRFVMREPPSVSNKDGSGTVHAVMDMLTPKKESLGTLSTDYTFLKKGPHVQIDAQIAIAADRGKSLKFGDTDDGGFALRLSDDFREDRGALLQNSEGAQGTKSIWGKPANWVDYSATVGGRKIGVAIFDHPSNLRHPTTWHARGYSLCSANPFGLRSFTGDKTKDGSYTLKSGDTLTLRYRILIHEDGFSKQDIDSWYAEYAGDGKQ